MRLLSTLREIIYRLQTDYFLGNRFGTYAALIDLALAMDYKFVSTIEYYSIKTKLQISLPGQKFIVCRHDVDSSTSIAEELFAIERLKGVHSSYYFRLSTQSNRLMQEIESAGSEASYHYEELATFCKKHKLRNATEVESSMSAIQELFYNNFTNIKKNTGLPMRSVASHGDFVNRKLGLSNAQLLTPSVRERCSIAVEAYDPIIKDDCLSISDCEPPQWWRPQSCIDAISSGVPVINLLTHPKYWKAEPWENFQLTTQRVIEELRYFHF